MGKMGKPSSILIESEKGLARVTLNRPERRNAFDADMVEEIREAFDTLGQDRSVRVIVLTGAGGTFCAGADIHWMGPDRTVSASEARADAERLGAMFRMIDECPCPVIARIQGAAYGGGLGLIAVSDIAVGAADSTFAFSEVRLGFVAGVIAPFVLRKTGASFARRFCLTGEPFPAATAREAGLIHEVVEHTGLDAEITALAEQVARAAPQAARDTKALLRRVGRVSAGEAWEACLDANVRARLSAEAQEGFRAFRERRPPIWVDPSGDT
ncbi:MAG TPA: enoyl-CoA hydratase-related protein [Nitrospira sp.]|nr:enoyl-CoA hydratase-related protein [Nitrospira sp.]